MSQQPYLIDWATTPDCNLKCLHCRGMSTGSLSNERARRLALEIADLAPKWVIVEGGEPLLRTDLFELLDLLHQTRVETHLISNGMLLDFAVLADIASHGAKLMLSIDGSTAETYERVRVGASFNKAMEKAQECVERGLLESINFTLMKSNMAEIPGMFNIARELGVQQITIIGYKPVRDDRTELLNAEEYSEAIKLACGASRKTGVGLFFDEPFFQVVAREAGLETAIQGSESGILDSSTSACIFGDYLFIEPNGDVKPCSFAPMVLGNVNEMKLDVIWSRALESPLLKRIKDPQSRTGPCRECRYLADCKGCRSRTYLLTGDWFASDPCCPLISMK